MERVGEMGETPHRKVNEEVAAATGPGIKTTEHHRTDGISLATPASGPQVNQKVELDLVKPPPVGNPGISYSDLLILIPGSRVISICLFYAIHIMKA